jgi:hypothetical protein
MARIVLPHNRRSALQYPGGLPHLNKNHPFYGSRLRLAAYTLPNGGLNLTNTPQATAGAQGGTYYDLVSNTISVAGAINQNHTTMTPVGPAIFATAASTGSARFTAPAIQETMAEVTLVAIMQVIQDGVSGTQTILTTMNFGPVLSFSSTNGFLFGIGGSTQNSLFDILPQNPQNGHCYYWAVSYKTGTGGKGIIVVNDLTTGAISVSKANRNFTAIASGSYYAMLTESSGVVQHHRVAYGIIVNKFFDERTLVAASQNPLNLFYTHRLDRMLTLSTEYHTASGGVAPPTNTGGANLPALTPTGTTTTVPTTFNCTTGTWTGSPTGYVYSFQATDVATGTTVLQATSSSSCVVTSAQNGKTITCVVTASNAGGSSAITASGSGTITLIPTVGTPVPSISGSTLVTSTLHCDHGTWVGSVTTYHYQWLRGATPVGTDSPDYLTVRPTDTGAAITCSVTAVNTAGTSSAFITNAITMVDVPQITTNPSVTPSGSQNVGVLLTCNNGVWTGSPTFTYQWKRGGTNISPGGTSQTYTTASADSTLNVGCVITATNVNGATSFTTNTVLVNQIPTVNTPPSISGSATQGNTLTCNPGDWNGSPTFTFQWKRDTTVIGPPDVIATYITVTADLGTSISCIVVATNVNGPAAPITTNSIGPITAPAAGVPPTINSQPFISGNSQVGSTLLCNPGSWSPTVTDPPVFSFQWASNGVIIPGAANAPTYFTLNSDIGNNIGCFVIGQNSVGLLTAPLTNQILVVAKAAPTTTPAEMGIVPSTGAELVQVLDNTNTWVPIGAVDPTTHTFVGVGSTGNRIINGDMRIDQRNNGAAGTGSSNYTIDRWGYYASQSSKIQWQRIATPASVDAPPFPYCLLLSTIAPVPTLGATDSFVLRQPIEADMVSDFMWGTVEAQPVTLSFWVLVTGQISGTFSGAICNGASTRSRSYPFTFLVPSPSVWTKVAVTIPPDIGGSGAWTLSGNGIGACLFFDLGAGANNRGAANAWANGSFIGAAGASSLVRTNAATMQITGVKLETGSVATPFERSTLAKNLSDCQRHYQFLQQQQLYGYTTPIGSKLSATLQFVTTMRAIPAPATSNPAFVSMNTLTIGTVTPSNYVATATATAVGTVSAIWDIALDAELY